MVFCIIEAVIDVSDTVIELTYIRFVFAVLLIGILKNIQLCLDLV